MQSSGRRLKSRARNDNVAVSTDYVYATLSSWPTLQRDHGLCDGWLRKVCYNYFHQKTSQRIPRRTPRKMVTCILILRIDRFQKLTCKQASFCTESN